jgi:hypothetical protein
MNFNFNKNKYEFALAVLLFGIVEGLIVISIIAAGNIFFKWEISIITACSIDIDLIIANMILFSIIDHIPVGGM